MKKYLRRFFVFGVVVIVLAAMLDAKPWTTWDWRKADRGSAGLSPLPESEPQAVVQGFAARAVRWRGFFAVHTWIATKEKDAKSYNVYHVIGWRQKRNQNIMVVKEDLPDRKWYGQTPTLLFDIRGERAEKIIPEILKATGTYVNSERYRAWPGPNSNTFISHILRTVPEIGVELPPHAIGKDWINNHDFLGITETGTGFQVSAFGVLGFTLGLKDGVEVNVLGLNFGLDFLRPALKLPMVGRVGMKDK